MPFRDAVARVPGIPQPRGQKAGRVHPAAGCAEFGTPLDGPDEVPKLVHESSGQLDGLADVASHRTFPLVCEGVLGQCVSEVVGERRVGHQQAGRLAPERAVHPG